MLSLLCALGVVVILAALKLDKCRRAERARARSQYRQRRRTDRLKQMALDYTEIGG